jgi:hypothetical protein
MDPNYVNRSLVKPWRMANDVAPEAAATPLSVLWTHLEQNMFELQVTAAENETHPTAPPAIDGPYPQ